MGNKTIHQLEESCWEDEGSSKRWGHIQANQAALAHLTTQHTGPVIQQLQNVAEQEKEQVLNRKAKKFFIRCARFLARQHIPHTTYFNKLVGW